MSDDFIFIVDNQASCVSAWSQDSYRAAGFEGAPPVVYRPLGIALLAGLKGLFGVSSPIPYRVLAVILHALNTILLMLWLGRLGLGERRALIAAALWSLLPIHAESLYWASALFDVTASSALLGALLLATRPSALLRLGAIVLWILAFLLKETALFGAVALLFTMVFCPLPREDSEETDVRPPMAGPAALGGLAIVAWWTARSLAGVQSPSTVPLDWSALAASFGEAIVRAVGLGATLRAGGPPLHGITLVAGIALVITAWYAWQASRRYPRVIVSVASLGLIGASQVLFGQSQTGFLVDPDRYFYLTSAFLPVCAVCAWNPSEKATRNTTVAALAGVGLLLVAWSWSAVASRASYEDFEAMLTHEIRIGRASFSVYFLRGVERMSREDPCAAEMDFRSALAMETNLTRRAQGMELALRAREACFNAQAAEP